MNRRKMITLALTGLATAGAVSATVGFVGKNSKANQANCTQTPDGKYVCKASGQVMDSPCCSNPDKK
jgi:hypothetical protein